MLTIVLSATMADGTVIVERTADLDLLAALVREFRADEARWGRL